MSIIKSAKNWKCFPFIFALAVLLLVSTSGCGTSDSEQSNSAKPSEQSNTAKPSEQSNTAPPIELKFAHSENTTNSVGKVLIADYAKALEQATNGRVKITIYPGETLLKAKDTYDGVVNKVADIGYLVVGYNPGLFPVMEATKVAGHPYDDWHGKVTTSEAVWNLYQKFKPKELQNVKVLLMASSSTGAIQTTKKPVRTMADLKGMQIGASGGAVDYIKRLGGIPVAVPMPQVKESMSKGVIEGYAVGFGPLKTFGLAEYVKYVTYAPFVTCTTFMVFMNLDTWNSLPPDIQKALEDESEKQRAQVWSKFYLSESLAALEWAQKEKNIEKIDLSAEETAKWLKVGKESQAAYEEKLNQLGLPGKEIMDTFFNPSVK